MFKIYSFKDLSKEYCKKYIEIRDRIFDILSKKYNTTNDVVMKSAEDIAIIELSMIINK